MPQYAIRRINGSFSDANYFSKMNDRLFVKRRKATTGSIAQMLDYLQDTSARLRSVFTEYDLEIVRIEEADNVPSYRVLKDCEACVEGETVSYAFHSSLGKGYLKVNGGWKPLGEHDVMNTLQDVMDMNKRMNWGSNLERDFGITLVRVATKFTPNFTETVVA